MAWARSWCADFGISFAFPRTRMNQSCPPVFVVLVDNECNLWRCRDVPQPREPFWCNTLRLPVHCRELAAVCTTRRTCGD